jgi:hypothetical protein
MLISGFSVENNFHMIDAILLRASAEAALAAADEANIKLDIKLPLHLLTGNRTFASVAGEDPAKKSVDLVEDEHNGHLDDGENESKVPSAPKLAKAGKGKKIKRNKKSQPT